MGILTGRSLRAPSVRAFGAVMALGLSMFAAPAAAQTHGQCVITQVPPPEYDPAALGYVRACDPDDPDYDTSFFSFNPLQAHVARSDRWEVEGSSLGPNTFSLSLSTYCKEEVWIAWKTLGGTATDGLDYDAVPGTTFKFPAGKVSAACGVMTMDDDLVEDHEYFWVGTVHPDSVQSGFCSGRLCADGNDTAALCILDNDGGGGDSTECDAPGNNPNPVNPVNTQSAWVTVSPDSLTVTEDDTNGDTYTVVLKTLPTGDVTVTIGGHSGTQVRVDESSLTFTTQTWDQPQTVKVTAVHDTDAENGEVTLTHTADGGGYNNVGADDVTVTIDDDDTASNRVTLTVNPTEVSEGVGSSGETVTVRATLNNAARTTDTEVTVSVVAGTASTGDFETVNDFTLEIDSGQMFGTADFQLKPVDDDVDENDETVTVRGSTSAPGISMASPAPTVTILDNDAGGVSLSHSTLTVREGEPAEEYRVWLDSQPTSNVAVTITGQAGTDLTLGSSSLTFTDQDWSDPQTVTVEAETDMDDVQNADITLTHTARGGGYNGESEELTVTIIDTSRVSDGVVLSVDPARVSESRGSSGETVTVTGQLNGATRTTATEVTVSVMPGTGANAAQTDDFTAVTPFTLTISANQPSGTATFRLSPVNDTLDEDDEILSVSGTTTATGLTSVESAELVIVDDDGAPSGIELSVSPGTLREDAGEQDIQVTARLVGGGSLITNTSVTLSVEDGTAIRGTDYTATQPGLLTIEAGNPDGTATFTITVEDDTDDESAETVRVTGTSSLTVHPATLTIVDNDGGGGDNGGGNGNGNGGGRGNGGGNGGGGGGGDGDTTRSEPPEFIPENAQAPEGSGQMVFTVRLSRATSRTVRVRWRTADRTAVSGADYAAASGTLFIPARDTVGKDRSPARGRRAGRGGRNVRPRVREAGGGEPRDQPGDRNDRRR